MVHKILGTGSVLYAVIYAVLIIFFTYFIRRLLSIPVDVSKNIQQYGGFIPGIRPGKPTSVIFPEFLQTDFVWSSIPGNSGGNSYLVYADHELTSTFSATGLLIMVGSP